MLRSQVTFLFIIAGKLFLHIVIILIVVARWRTEFRSCENATNWKFLTFDLDYLSAPTRSHWFFSSLELVLGLWVLSCEVVFSMGSCWRIELWGLENCTRALFVNGSRDKKDLPLLTESEATIFIATIICWRSRYAP